MTNDTISDMISRIKNGYSAHISEVRLPWAKSAENLARVLLENHYVKAFSVSEGQVGKELVIELLYSGKKPAITDFKRVSKPSLRVYVNNKHLPRVLGGMGAAIISTPKGLMTDKKARKEGLGGEIWCKVW